MQLGNLVEVKSDSHEVGLYSLSSYLPICFLPTGNELTEKNLEFILDSPKMFNLLEKVHFMYSKGIKPSVGFINEIETLIKNHS